MDKWRQIQQDFALMSILHGNSWVAQSLISYHVVHTDDANAPKYKLNLSSATLANVPQFVGFSFSFTQSHIGLSITGTLRSNGIAVLPATRF